jgi:hypothetical protein
MIKVGVLVIAVLAAVASALHSDSRAHPRQEPAPIKRAEYRGVVVAVPRTWHALPAAADTRSWRHGSSNVTLGILPAARSPLIAVVTASDSELKKTVPGYRNGSIRIVHDDLGDAIALSFETGGTRAVRVDQLWRRLPRGKVDAVATWVRPLHTPLQTGFGGPPRAVRRR